MKNDEEFNVNVHIKVYLFLKVTDKLKIIIRYNKVENIVFLIEFCESGVVYTDSIDFSYKYECGIFKEAVYDNYYINADFSVNINE